MYRMLVVPPGNHHTHENWRFLFTGYRVPTVSFTPSLLFGSICSCVAGLVSCNYATTSQWSESLWLRTAAIGCWFND